MEHGAYRHDNPDTSVSAAKSIDVTPLETKVLNAICAAWPDGRTARELVEELGIGVQTISPRFKPLRDKGLIFDSGERRPGNSGRMQIVWKARRHVIEGRKRERD